MSFDPLEPVLRSIDAGDLLRSEHKLSEYRWAILPFAVSACSIVHRVGMTIEPIRHLFGDNNRPTGQRGFYVWSRSGAGCIDVDAFRMLSIPTTA